jgi:putative ABC transport system permease protein
MDTPLQLLWAIGLGVWLLLLAAGQRLSITLGLGIALVRGVLQLFVFAYLVAMVVQLRDPWVTLGAVGVLLVLSVLQVRNQLTSRFEVLPMTVLAMTSALLLPLAYGIVCVVQPQPWYEGRVVIPIAGMILANAMNGAVVAGDHLIQSLQNNPGEIETHLSLGATEKIAIAPYRQAAIRVAMQPLIGSLTVLGLAGVPSLMAGGMLGGFDPLQAAAYQMLLLLLGALATLIAVLVLCWGIGRQFFNRQVQLRRW